MKVPLSEPALAELDAILLSDIRAANPLEARIKRVFERIAQFPKGAQEVENRLAFGASRLCATLVWFTTQSSTAK